MILKITKVLDKIKLVKALNEIFPNMPFKERFTIVKCLPFESNSFYGEKKINNLLSDCAEYTYTLSENELRNQKEYEEYLADLKEYQAAKLWYDKLPLEDQKKIDILIASNVPHAC